MNSSHEEGVDIVDEQMQLFSSLPDMLEVQDVQRVLRIGRIKAYKLVESNQLKHIRIGRNIRIPKVFLLEYVLKQ